MSNEVVSARAYEGAPLRVVALSTANGLVYVASERSLEAVQEGLISAIGFPQEDVFRFDPNLHARLVEQWEADGSTDPALWDQLQPYVGTPT